MSIEVSKYPNTILQSTPKVWILGFGYLDNWRNKVILMEDGAPCHTANVIHDYLRDNWGQEVFWRKDKCFPSSPDLNPPGLLGMGSTGGRD